MPFTVTQEAAIPDGAIPITHLEQLYAMRYDLDGNGKVDHAGNLADTDAAGVAYAAAFPGVVSGNKYTGYKLTKDLDFNQNASYSDHVSRKSGWTSGAGWNPIGTSSNRFTGTFNGEGHTISNLYINRTEDNAYIGLCSRVNGTIQKVGLVSPNVTGGAGPRAGDLVGQQSSGTLIASYDGGKNYTKLKGTGNGNITNSYYQRSSSSGNGKTETELKTPTAYGTPPNNIYKNWNLNLDGNAGGDDPWDFGTSSQYPVLKGIDADGDVDATDLAEQRK